MDMEELLETIGGTQAARDYMQGIVEGTEQARNADRALRGAVHYIRGAGIRDGMALAQPELYAQAAYSIAADWSETLGNAQEGARTQVPIGARSIIVQMRYARENREA